MHSPLLIDVEQNGSFAEDPFWGTVLGGLAPRWFILPSHGLSFGPLNPSLHGDLCPTGFWLLKVGGSLTLIGDPQCNTTATRETTAV